MRELEARYPCPVCLGVAMTKTPIGRDGALVLDHCARCGGVWFDAGELPDVLSFVERGGLERARKLEAERERRARVEQRAAASKQFTTLGLGGSESESVKEIALIELITSLLTGL